MKTQLLIREIQPQYGSQQAVALAAAAGIQGLELMECSDEFTPHDEKPGIYSSAYDGRDSYCHQNLRRLERRWQTGEGIDEVPTRSQGECANTP